MISTERAMTGTGSTPASAMRPAKTEMQEGAPSATAAVIVSTWAVVNRAVTFTFTPSSESSRTSAASDSPAVVVTGTFTYTFSPHEEIRRAWRAISGGSSANTSKEIGWTVTRSSRR